MRKHTLVFILALGMLGMGERVRAGVAGKAMSLQECLDTCDTPKIGKCAVVSEMDNTFECQPIAPSDALAACRLHCDHGCEQKVEGDDASWFCPPLEVPTCPNGQVWTGSLVGGSCKSTGVPATRDTTNKSNNTKQSSGSTGSSAPATPVCISQYQNDISNCTSVYTSAQYDCDTSHNSGLNGVTDTASQAALGLGQQTGGSVAAACGSMGGVSQGASAALAAYRTNCANSKNSCMDACSGLKSKIQNCAVDNGTVEAVKNSDEYKKVASNVSGCSSLQTKIDQANQALQNYANTNANAQNCAQATAATSDPSQIPSTDPNSPYCQSHPTVAACVASCSRTDLPEIANSKTCICFRNPNDASCTSASSSSQVNNFGSQGGGVPSTTNSANSANDLNLTDDPSLALASIKSKGNGAPAEDVGGKQGNGAAIGGGDGLGGGGGGLRGSHAVASEIPVKAGGGFYGGGGSYGSGFFGGGGGGGSAGRGGGSVPTSTAKTNGPDLRQFLPGGKMDPARGLAGMAGIDGVSGPETGNWIKIQRRYRMLESTLLP